MNQQLAGRRATVRNDNLQSGPGRVYKIDRPSVISHGSVKRLFAAHF